MQVSRRCFLRGSGLGAFGLLAGWSGSRLVEATDEGDNALHVLKRLTWGVRPEDLERIRALGISAYIDWQLEYEQIADPQVDEFIAARRILTMSYDEMRPLLVDQYEHVLVTAWWGRIFRAVYSERQLYERMVEFWTDHFNVPIADWLGEKMIDDRDVIRRHALGRFRDLLFASARSPAMLYYLDNAFSSKAHPNENYAREIMELHTLGVDGGYTERDVLEVARAFTGWTVNQGTDSGFYFNRDEHDDGEKWVLGHRLASGRGIEDGLEVLDILATHPSTARFICYKLCRRFVADMPPEAVVEASAQVFLRTDGDLRETLRFIFNAPEFYAAKGEKFRRPLELVVAMLRVLSPGIQLENPSGLIYGTLEPLNHLPYLWAPPNGYPDVGAAWINTNALLNRWNTALKLALAGEGQVEGAALNLDAVLAPQATVGALVDAAADRILGGKIGDADRRLLVSLLGDEGAEGMLSSEDYRAVAPTLVGVLLASPYFQWH